MKISKISNCGIARFTLYVKDIIYNFILNARIFLKASGNKDRHRIHLKKLKILGHDRYLRLLKNLSKGGR
jgi:hypothetical protein